MSAHLFRLHAFCYCCCCWCWVLCEKDHDLNRPFWRTRKFTGKLTQAKMMCDSIKHTSVNRHMHTHARSRIQAQCTHAHTHTRERVVRTLNSIFGMLCLGVIVLNGRRCRTDGWILASICAEPGNDDDHGVVVVSAMVADRRARMCMQIRSPHTQTSTSHDSGRRRRRFRLIRNAYD